MIYIYVSCNILNFIFDFQKAEMDFEALQLPSFSSLPPMSTINDTFHESDNDVDDSMQDDNSNSGDNLTNNPEKFAQYPRPKIVPVDYNKKKQVCVCEQCGGSWSRKEYYYHHKVFYFLLSFIQFLPAVVV